MSETDQAIAVARVSDAALVDVSDGFCALVGKPRQELLGRTAADLGISNRDRLDWLISRFPDRGRSHHQQRVFETPRGRVLADMDIHGIEIGGERLIVSVITAVSGDASPDGASSPRSSRRRRSESSCTTVSFGSSVSTGRSSGSAASVPSTSAGA